ncbi:MAG: DUF3592 domain-containing protein [Lachnospiraceae bacterium]|nr:DUF3592 domain-containing protein [Lachnospiraceae bacterium]
MTDLSQLLLYIPGIVIFLVGSGQVRQWLQIHRKGACIQAQVVSCKHVVKKDKKERELYNYYDVGVTYTNPDTKRLERLAVKSPTEYALNQPVRMLRGTGGIQPTLMEQKDEFPLNPWVMMIGGALLIILALEQNQGNEVPAMACLALIFLGVGVNLVLNYLSLKKRGLRPVEAEITALYTRQISQESKILKNSKFTYYPVVRYELDGQECVRRCNINSSGEKNFRVGDHMKLYYDPQEKVVLEKHASAASLAVGVLLTALGILVGASILTVVL